MLLLLDPKHWVVPSLDGSGGEKRLTFMEKVTAVFTIQPSS